MARTELKSVVNQFVGGLITDYHELNTPENVTVDEDNVDLDRKGSRRRRKGIEFENEYETQNITAARDTYLKTYEWNSVNNDGDVNFLVVQAGNYLYFYDKSAEPLSSGQYSFGVNLGDHLAAGQSTTADAGVQVASGKGVLFVVGAKINPFYITYDEAGSTITETTIDIRIRDLEELDTVLANDAQPSTITDERRYDLYNQGWNQDDKLSYDLRSTTGAFWANVFNFYRNTRGKYPPKTKPWWVGKRIGDDATEVFDPSGQYDMIEGGNTLAPLGHFILDPFNKDRATASGVAIPTVTETERPTAVAFHAGRVFYGFQNKVFFSQVIEDDLSVAGKCYQDADPTSEHIFDLVAVDGGVIQITTSGKIFSLFPMDNSLIVFTTNGVWSINGSSVGEGFSATGHSVSKITSLDAVSTRTIISIEGIPCWWGTNGIYTLTSNPSKDGFSTTNLLEGKIQNFYDAIPSLSKRCASGTYDKIRKIIVWVFSDVDPNLNDNLYFCNRVLNLDTVMGAFYPYTITPKDEASPYISDVFPIESLLAQRVEEIVVDNLDDPVVTNNGASVTAFVGTELVEASFSSGGVKYLTVVP